MKKILDVNVFDGMIKINPAFSNYPFVTCFEMSMLSVLNYYHKNILPFMTKMNFSYKYYDKDADLIFYTITPEFDGSFDALKELGIEKRVHHVEEEKTLECLRNCIIDGHPTQFMIDLFYQEGKEFFYQFQHGGHYVNGYGIDDENGILHTIDNVHGYAKYEVKYEELNQLRGNYQGTEIWEFVNCNEIDTFSKSFEDRMINMYRSGIREQYDMRMEGINEIRIMRDSLPFCMEIPIFSMSMEGIAYNRISELCRLLYLRKYDLYQEDAENRIEELLRSIVKKWQKMYSLLNYKRMTEYSGEDYEKESICLNAIMDYEKELCDLLVNGLKQEQKM